MIFRFGVLLILLIVVSCKESIPNNETSINAHNYLIDFPAFSKDSLVNIVIEIPAGTDQKWEVNKTSGHLEWERINKDSLRIIKFLPYPVNYGFIPQTLLPKDLGGDGDPLDVFLLGSAIDRGNVIPSQIIGVIKMLDKGEQDDKLIAVSSGTPFSHIESLEQLIEEYPGVIEVLKSWLSNYKGEGYIEILAVESKESAIFLLQTAIEGFQKKAN
ncbi:MAG: inorganic diphosphatase [Flavobacteriaceae bacterium]|nr:inorganic diphosphatase [Flavobacteriaceae bacterium]